MDRFGDVLVAQLPSATMEQYKNDVLAALLQVLAAKVGWFYDHRLNQARLAAYTHLHTR